MYTLEGNYATGVRINTLMPKWDIEKKEKIKQQESELQDTSSAFYAKRKIPIYNAEVFFDVGRAFLISILDISCLNPVSRLLRNANDTLEQCIERIREEIKRDLNRPSLKNLKRIKGKKKEIVFELVMPEEK